MVTETLGWRWYVAIGLYLLAVLGFVSGVGISERPDLDPDDYLTQAYYSLGLFVVGGLDLGVPQGGPWWGRSALWIAYFGAPLLTASAVIEAVIRVMAPQRWQLRRLSDHTVVVGAGSLTPSYLRSLRQVKPKAQVVVVDQEIPPALEQELVGEFGVIVVVGDVTHDYMLRLLRLDKAHKVLIFGESDFQSYESATRMLALYPHLAGSIILRCNTLRFMRSMADTAVANACVTFNSYNFAAVSLVHGELLQHFRSTKERDVVVIAGFGRFGQTILEELQASAMGELQDVIIIDADAERRVQVVEEQVELTGDYHREILQGDIAHPAVWRQVQSLVDLDSGEPVIILGTGNAAENLRTALWIRQSWPNCVVYTRTNTNSRFVDSLREAHGIRSVSIRTLLEENMPRSWL